VHVYIDVFELVFPLYFCRLLLE